MTTQTERIDGLDIIPRHRRSERYGGSRQGTHERIAGTRRAPVQAPERKRIVAPAPPNDSATRPNGLVIIPTYNEIDNLEPLVLRVLAEGPFDVLIVDDNSPDGTGARADYLAWCLHRRVAVLHRPGKLGLGTAYLEGFRYALAHGYSRVFQMDADFSHNPSTLPRLYAALDDADVVLGSRYTPGGSSRGLSPWRQLLSRCGSRYAGLVLGVPARDLTGGFKGFRRQVLESLDLSAIRSTGYAFQIEVTYRCHRLGYRIAEVPIEFGTRRAGQSKMSGRIIAEALMMVWRLRLSAPQAEEARR